MRSATSPCFDTFCRFDRLGLSVTCQRVESDHTVLCCRPITPPSPCSGCAGRQVRGSEKNNGIHHTAVAVLGLCRGRGLVMTRSLVVWCMCLMAGNHRSWKWWCRVTNAGHVAGCGVTASGLRPHRRENCHATRSSQSWSTGCQSPGPRPIGLFAVECGVSVTRRVG